MAMSAFGVDDTRLSKADEDDENRPLTRREKAHRLASATTVGGGVGAGAGYAAGKVLRRLRTGRGAAIGSVVGSGLLAGQTHRKNRD